MSKKVNFLRKVLAPRSASGGSRRLRGEVPEFSGDSIANPPPRRKRTHEDTPVKSKTSKRSRSETEKDSVVLDSDWELKFPLGKEEEATSDQEPQPGPSRTQRREQARDTSEESSSSESEAEEDPFDTGSENFEQSLLEEIKEVDSNFQSLGFASPLQNRRKYSQYLQEQNIERLNTLRRRHSLTGILNASGEVSYSEEVETFKSILDESKETFSKLRAAYNSLDTKLETTPEKEMAPDTIRDVDGEETEVINRPVMSMADSLMPRFNQTLTKVNLSNFFDDLRLWARGKNINERVLKTLLPLAIQNRLAREYLSIRKYDLIDDEISFEEFCAKFLDECPVEADEDFGSPFNLLSLRQPPNKKASHFVQRIRYLCGANWDTSEEGDYVKHIVPNLEADVSRYIVCRGMPRTYDGLIKIINEYELSGVVVNRSKLWANNQVDIFKKETGSDESPTLLIKSIFENNARQDQDRLVQEQIKQLTDKMENLQIGDQRTQHRTMNNSRFNNRGQFNRNFNNTPRCFNCNKTGHIAINCWQRGRQGNAPPQRTQFNHSNNQNRGFRRPFNNSGINRQGNFNNRNFQLNSNAQAFTPRMNRSLNA
ncbi:unnamed protein product [Orchesella dallaii]|uniref:CCHC-type domain-containing protein n=1 Tax=Orchesella dallaii TaxID=48710 RepID=A0ABP1R8J5_9HEXA